MHHNTSSPLREVFMNHLLRVVAPLIVASALLPTVTVHATPITVSTPIPAIPPNIVTGPNRPMMMLATSKDHTLFGPVYTDFEDLESSVSEPGFGVIDTEFKPSFPYYGYFDRAKCYAYNTTDGRFNPAANSIMVDGRYTCSHSNSHWSGNFLNWATTTRLDVVRKMLYGGKRFTDLTGLTVLERTGLNWDAHSFTKYYAGTDIRDYTPFTTAALTKTTGINANIYAGLTICQTGTAESPTGGTPIMKMVKGNYRLWNTVEVTVCKFNSGDNANTEGQFSAKLARYYKGPSGTTATDAGLVYGGGPFKHELTLPDSTTDGATYDSGAIGPVLTVRVKVCDAAMLGQERCQAFPPDSTTNYKPFGLFQEFGYASGGGGARAEFGVITGSYDKNTTAGALRKNMGDFADEINANTGVFCHSASSGCATTLPDGRATGKGAIKAIDNFLLYGRTTGNNYGGATSNPISDGTLPAWGNPMGEMVVQALQYYSYNGSTPAPTNPTSTGNDTNAKLPVTNWSDPLSNANVTRKANYGNAICRPMYTLALSSSALSFDQDPDAAFLTLPYRDGKSINDFTNIVGNAEEVNGAVKSVGNVVGAQGNSCSAKTIGNLSNVTGVCPDAPAMLGTYKVAGAALYANTSKIRILPEGTEPADLSTVKDALKVKTLAASLSGGAARIDVLIPGTGTATVPAKYVYITPESLWDGHIGSALTFVSLSSSATHGAFIVTWNDALMGGDHDMDLTGFIRYDLVEDTSTSPSTWDIIVTTDAPNNCSGRAGTHGFSIIGVTKKVGTSQLDGNGRYLTHQHYNINTIGSVNTNEPNGYLCGNQAGAYSNFRGLINGSYATTGTTLDGLLNTTNRASQKHLTVRNWTYASPTDETGTSDTTRINKDGACQIHNEAGETPVKRYCQVQNKDFQVQMRFKMTGVADAVLKDPLWYAAKYGSFDSSKKNTDGSIVQYDMPPDVASWDKLKVDGTAGADGIPDGYFLARRPDLLEQQLRKALDELAKNSNAAPAVSSSQLITDGFKYVAKFDSTTIEGNIEAYEVDDLGNFEIEPKWRAGHKLRIRTSGVGAILGDNGNSRHIITNLGNPSSAVTGSGASPFRWASLPAGLKTQLTTASTNKLSEANAELVVNYLRGDQSKEAASTGLRERNDNILGPVVSATPWIQDRPIATYSELQFPGYTSFVTDHKDRAKLLWVSANDGMLHAFKPDDGEEVFAYVPGTLVNRLAEIPLQRGSGGRTRLNGANFTLDAVETQPTGVVWPYVDGNPFTGDVLVDVNGTPTWKTYVFGSLGRGGKALFALDATNITSLANAEANAASIFKWQFTSDDDADLGYLVNDISSNPFSGQSGPIVKLNNGKFALLIGNGYKSSSGKAVLFMLYMDGPSAVNSSWTGRYSKIVADAGTDNGLSTPTWVDLDNNGTADAVYAGDLKGQLWKFNLGSATASDWDVAYKSGTTNRPLFTAKDGASPLPITTAPEFSFPSFDGLIITFGTGNALEATDFPNTAVNQRVYGIWDRPGFSDAVTPRPLPPSDLSTLVPRTYSRLATGNVIVTGTPAAIDWVTKDGWYFNLPSSSEMVLSDPDMRAGVLTFTTVRPLIATETCSNSPLVSLYTIDPMAGMSTRNSQGTSEVSSVTYLNNATEIQDQKVKVVNDRTVRAFTTKCRKGDPGCTCVIVAGVEECTKDNGAPTCGPGQSALRVVGQGADASICYSPNGRVQWREIPGLRTDQ